MATIASIFSDRKYTKWWLAIFVIITFFVNNHVLVPDIMESRNIITAREMVYDGNWVVTTMNGDLRLEKPPLPTWATALAEIISPDSLFLQRAMAGCAALLLVVFFYRFAKRVLRIDPTLATLILCTCYNMVLMGRTASWDIYCHAFMMAAICLLAEALPQPGRQWPRMLGAGVMIGLSIMSKGPVSLYGLLLSFLIAYGVECRPTMQGKWLPVAVMALLAAAIGTWWYAYIHLTQPEALAHVAGKESGAWFNHNVRPWYYYWTFFLETGIWSVAMLTVLAYAVVCRWKRMSKPLRMSLLWLLAALVLLSLLPEKKNRYLLPILIPASMAIAAMFCQWKEAFNNGSATRFVKTAFSLNGWLLVAAGVVVIGATVSLCINCGMAPAAGVAMAVCAAIATVLIWSGIGRRSAMRYAWGVALLFASAECLAMPAIGRLVNNPEMKSIKLTRDMPQLEGIPFYHNAAEPIRIELVYAADKKIKPLDFSDSAAVMSALPCAVMTHRYATEELPAGVAEQIDTTYIDRFDDNRRPKGNRRHNNDVIYHLTILNRK